MMWRAGGAVGSSRGSQGLVLQPLTLKQTRFMKHLSCTGSLLVVIYISPKPTFHSSPKEKKKHWTKMILYVIRYSITFEVCFKEEAFSHYQTGNVLLCQQWRLCRWIAATEWRKVTTGQKNTALQLLCVLLRVCVVFYSMSVVLQELKYLKISSNIWMMCSCSHMRHVTDMCCAASVGCFHLLKWKLKARGSTGAHSAHTGSEDRVKAQLCLITLVCLDWQLILNHLKEER